MSEDMKYHWEATASDSDGYTAWATRRAHRGYTGAIAFASNEYTLTITGSGAPAAAAYPTLRNAKNAFRKFLLEKANLDA